MGALRSDVIQAIRGPIMLITLGVLVSLDYFQGISFQRRTWPVLLIVFGLMKLLEKSFSHAAPAVPPPPMPPAQTGVYPERPGTQPGGQLL